MTDSSVSTGLLKNAGLAMPKCWADLTKPEFKGKVQVASPQSFGTAYTATATFVQLWGEKKAFDYFKKLHANGAQHTKSGSAPRKKVPPFKGDIQATLNNLHDALYASKIISYAQGFMLMQKALMSMAGSWTLAILPGPGWWHHT